METINLSELANLINAIKHCKPAYQDLANSTIDEMDSLLPHGSGIDGICEIDRNNSTIDKIIVNLEYHHLNDAGYYEGWTSHQVILTPSFIGGFDLKVTGKDKNGIKDYLSNLFYDCFTV